MTTTPVISVTDELLAEIEDGCLDSVDCPLSMLSDLAAELRTLRAERAELKQVMAGCKQGAKAEADAGDEARAEVRQLKQELAACREDAGRYRWLCAPIGFHPDPYLILDKLESTKAEVDEAIDLAMQEQAE